MDAAMGFLGQLGPALLKVLPMLDERSRRLVLGMAAEAEGKGGTGRVAAMTGASWQTVANGRAELDAEEELPPGRRRRPGGGRRPLEEADPGLVPALEKLIRDAMRGDPESPLVWTTRSAEHLAGELTAAGDPCSDSTVWRMLRRAGFTQQSNSRAQEGRQHPEWDGQSRHIAARSREYLEAGDPVISVDSKKKEQVGNFGQDGREWAPAGEPVAVRSHDFPDRKQPYDIPYGIYDEKDNAGFVNVGTDGNTAALAVESIRRWWGLVGKAAYPDAARLLVTCDSGGSNAAVSRAWKAGLAGLAAETGLDITVCHFPPGTSKWNKIEHRLFCQITLAWRGRPLTGYDVIIDTIGAVTTTTGLACAAVLHENAYPTGLEVSDQQMRAIEDRHLTRHDWHGEWNYTLLAAPRPAPPPPQPPPARRPRLLSGDDLARPALTGASPQAVAALAAALAGRLDARIEHDHRVRRAPRTRAPTPPPPRRFGPADYLHAALLKRHLGVPSHVTAAILGTDDSAVRRMTRITADILAAARTSLPPPAQPPPRHRIRPLAQLRESAARHGIHIPEPPPQPPPRIPRQPPPTRPQIT